MFEALVKQCNDAVNELYSWRVRVRGTIREEERVYRWTSGEKRCPGGEGAGGSGSCNAPNLLCFPTNHVQVLCLFCNKLRVVS